MVAIVDSYRVTNMIEGDGKELLGGVEEGSERTLK